jgi:hypothetical protein
VQGLRCLGGPTLGDALSSSTEGTLRESLVCAWTGNWGPSVNTEVEARKLLGDDSGRYSARRLDFRWVTVGLSLGDGRSLARGRAGRECWEWGLVRHGIAATWVGLNTRA